MRVLRGLGLTTLGFVAGTVAAAGVARRVLISRGDDESDEVALFAIFDGVELTSRARAFRGGSILTWFGGAAVDLRAATLSPDAHLTVGALFGGVDVKLPTGWRVVSTGRAIAGGVADQVAEPEDAGAPTLVVESTAAFGGISIRAVPSEPLET